MKKIIYLLLAIFSFASCETIDLEQTENPSAANEKLLDPVYTFNYVQLQLPEFVNSVNNFTQRVTRQMAMTGGNTYDNAFAPVNFDNTWFLGYNILYAVKAMEPKALESKDFYKLGASKLIRAYVLLTLTDMFGDIPVTEALQGNKNLTPKYDKSVDVYKMILVELEEANVLLTKSADTEVKTDLYYNGEKDKWINLSNTLKLKIFVNAKLAGSDIGFPNIGSAIGDIISQGKIIDAPGEDFLFNYGNSRFSPNTRHPLYNDQYELGGGAYIGNYMIWAMTIEKDLIKDPRTDFYFFRQNKNALNSYDDFTIPRLTRPTHYPDERYSSFFTGGGGVGKATYKVSNWTNQQLMPGTGYLGRDHGDNAGIPPDAEIRAVAGLYPVGGLLGGQFGTVSGSVQKSGESGKKGDGIMPIVLSSYVHFLLSEAMLTAGVSGNPKSEFLLGVNQSIDTVLSQLEGYNEVDLKKKPFPNAAEASFPIGTLVIDNAGTLNSTIVNNFSPFYKINVDERKTYIDYISDVYDSSSNNKKLELVIKEFYIASWGNGIEPYNSYRRTGYPSNFQPTLEFSDEPFYSTALYPANAVNNNPNVPTNVRTRKVFWDKATFALPLH